MAELTHDTSEDGFHEIQLSGKQLVFLFMLGTGALVLVFLLGVQVGRDVRAERGDEAIDAAPVATAANTGGAAAGTAEPSAPVKDENLSYPNRLDKTPPVETMKDKPPEPEPVQETKPPAAEPAPQAASTPPPDAVRAPAAAAPKPEAPAGRTAATVPTSGRAGRWVVQVITLSNRAGAAEVTQGLIAKGYPAFLMLPPSGTPNLYRVQIGRYNDRAEADRVARRLSREEKVQTRGEAITLLALVSGALLALSFPKWGHPACAWLALTPLIVAVWRAGSVRRSFYLGLLAGAVYFWGTLYWLIETMTTFGGLSTITAVLAAAVLVAYLSLFPAAFAVLLARFRQTYGDRALWLVAPIWVTTELGRQYVWDGFPWALLGYSQVTVLPVVQIASVVGVYGVSALLAMVSAAAAALVLLPRRSAWPCMGAAVLIAAGSTAWGFARLEASLLLQAGSPVRVAVLQGNIAQDDKWDPALRDEITSKYLRMTREALGAGATFIIWPESSTPFLFEHDLIRGGAIRRLASEAGATLLIGSDQVEPVARVAPQKPEARYYNAAFLVRANGQVGAVYRKMHLVPFGEYVPLKNLLFFVGPIVEAVSAFTPGADPVLLPVGEHVASTAICYEVIFPNLIRRFVQDGSELLTTITNDAWYGRSSAAYQHWDQAAMRSIEQGRYLARAANTGISGFVDPYGRAIDKTDLFHDAVVIADLRFITERTIYNRIGDLAAWLSLALTSVALLASFRIR